MRRSEVSSTELVRLFSNRIGRFNSSLRAYWSLTPDLAIKQAGQADKVLREDPESVGPLHGVPVAIKDNTRVQGYPLTFGSRAFESNVALLLSLARQLEEAKPWGARTPIGWD